MIYTVRLLSFGTGIVKSICVNEMTFLFWCVVDRVSLWNEPIHGRTTYQPDLTTFLQPRHIPTQGYNITQYSAADDGHMVARNMLSNY